MKRLLVYSLFFIPFLVWAQKTVDVKLTNNAPQIDGALDDDIWTKTTPAGDFWQYFPTDSVLAEAQTEIHLAYDEQNLYVGIKCFGAGKDWIINSLKRDYRAGGNDNITIVFDSFDDRTNGFFFGINPLGVIREGTITNGGNGRGDFSSAWDNKWQGEAKIYDEYYTAEMEIPLSTLRYKSGSDTWGMHAYRFDTQNNETSVWNQIQRNQTMFSVAYSGVMKWEKPLQSGSSNISLIPYVSTNFAKNYEDGTPSNFDMAVGGDMKVGISTGLNLDLTANPDFAQVEVDRQVTNIDRFEIFFPERRQFFLENADLFGGFGFSSTNPFFSRRIGVGTDTTTNTTVQNRILGGARLSGKLNQDLRVGLLTMQTAEESTQGLPSTNFTVLSAQHKLWRRSNIGFIVVNKQTGDEGELLDDKYNRVAGIDFNYANADNSWSGKTFLHSSFSPETDGLKLAHGTKLSYNTRRLKIGWEHEIVQDDYNAQVGFIRRTDFFKLNPEIELSFYPSEGPFSQMNYGLTSTLFSRPGVGRTDQSTVVFMDGQFRNSSRFNINIGTTYVLLTGDFDPTGTSSEKLAADTDYNYLSLRGFYSSDRRKEISFSLMPYLGEYFNGFRAGLRGSLNFRFQPKGFVSLSYAYNYFDMPHLDGKRETFLVGPRIDYTLSKEIFMTLFLQYNSQSKNTNINGRFQWRFAPVSDFFLVYTDNYTTGNVDDPSNRFAFDVKNRAIVAKLTYWLNI